MIRPSGGRGPGFDSRNGPRRLATFFIFFTSNSALKAELSKSNLLSSFLLQHEARTKHVLPYAFIMERKLSYCGILFRLPSFKKSSIREDTFQGCKRRYLVKK